MQLTLAGKIALGILGAAIILLVIGALLRTEARLKLYHYLQRRLCSGV